MKAFTYRTAVKNVGGVVVIDEKGRIVIPSEERRKLGLRPGDRLTVSIENGAVVLRPIIPKPVKVKANRKWGDEAFLKAGEATFGD